MRPFILAALLLATTGLSITAPRPASAQATCRQACMNDENACLQRTNNKGQCGGKAQSCSAKCR